MATKDKDEAQPSFLPVPAEQATAVMDQSGYSTEIEDSPEDFDLPQLRLMSGNSQPVLDGDARPGDWWLPGTGVIKDPVIIPIGRKVTRELREAQEIDPAMPVLCWSADAVVGNGEPGGDCRTCPFARSSGGWPPCTRITNFGALLVNDVGLGDEPLPITMALRRSAGREATMVLNNLFRAKAAGTTRVALSSRQRGSGNRVYYQVIARIVSS